MFGVGSQSMSQAREVSEAVVYEALKSVQDPEMGVNIVDLGLITALNVSPERIRVDFTLTFPGCPAGELIRKDIVTVLYAAFGITDIEATLVWQPRWSPARMSEEARLELGYPI
jgi:metal-sulfur cluster biosynthetic enzyme